MKETNYTLKQLTEMLNVPRDTFVMWVKYYEFPKACAQNKKVNLWSKSDVDKWLKDYPHIWRKKSKSLTQKREYEKYGENLTARAR